MPERNSTIQLIVQTSMGKYRQAIQLMHIPLSKTDEAIRILQETIKKLNKLNDEM